METTSSPGVVYVFARRQEDFSLVWSYYFGQCSGGARISIDGSHIVAVGGDQSDAGVRRLCRFSQDDSFPRYQKLIPELPSSWGLVVSSNGSVFAISYTNRNELVLFDMNVRPYGPSSIRNIALPSSRVSMSMSSDGEHIFVGASSGLFFYKYSNNELCLSKQYTTNTPFINDVASSLDGRYIAALGYWKSSDDQHSQIYFFDNSRETFDAKSLWTRWGPLIAGMGIVITGTVGFIIFRRRKHQRAVQLRFFAVCLRRSLWLF